MDNGKAHSRKDGGDGATTLRSRRYFLGGALLALAGTSRAPRADSIEWKAIDYGRRTIYHSPQTPGYTCWTGAWSMPDGDLMVSFTQATGPVEGRPAAPPEVQKQLSWSGAYDMTGLDLRNVHLRSSDGGETWKQVSADPFKSCMNGVTGEAETALRDGTILRSVWGFYLPYNPELPKTGYFERSRDGSKTWGKPEVVLDPARYWAWPKRLRHLKDGRLLILGGFARIPANSRTRAELSPLFEPLLMTGDKHGKSLRGPIEAVPEPLRQNWGGEEWDAAELPNGDLLCVFRRLDPKLGRESRWQGVLKKNGASWSIADVQPSALAHSGHPELLATREGPVLHVATNAIHGTVDAGRTWQRLDLPGTPYYPRSVQAQDGTIHVFGHLGADDAYGSRDQAIVMDTFRLATG